MQLLFDQNLSPKLVEKLADIYPNSIHIQNIGLGKASDKTIWEYAKENGFTIVTKDADFHEQRILSGEPPNIVWLRRGNCSTEIIESLLRQNYKEINKLSDEEKGFIIIQ
jgi:predicted nuclease of predicted toxin-antitoxin system